MSKPPLSQAAVYKGRPCVGNLRMSDMPSQSASFQLKKDPSFHTTPPWTARSKSWQVKGEVRAAAL